MAERTSLGDCPICLRPMLAGGPVDRHHLLPKSRGGNEATLVHRICHRQIHALWTNRELENGLSDPQAIRSDPRMTPFLVWIAGKHPDFYVRTAGNAERRRRRR